MRLIFALIGIIYAKSYTKNSIRAYPRGWYWETEEEKIPKWKTPAKWPKKACYFSSKIHQIKENN